MMWKLLARLLLPGCLLCGAAQAQTAPSVSAVSGGSAALEMPLLAVDHEHRPVDDVKVSDLKIKLGTAPPFTPISMRRQGEDPLSLGILVDASRDSFHDLSKLGDEFASLVGSLLLPSDRITLYAADCTMTRSLRSALPEPASLRKGFVDALAFPSLHEGKTHSACGKTVHLWDDVAAVVAALSKMPGRRALLLISSGADGGSQYDWQTVSKYAFDQGVAIFALRDKRQADADDYTAGSMSTTNGHTGRHIAPPTAPRNANGLELLCANDGGLTLTSSPEFRKDGLADIIFLIKNRLILSIRKEDWQPGDAHGAKVTATTLTPYFMTATGAQEPLETK